jgi:hypothetical protein
LKRHGGGKEFYLDQDQRDELVKQFVEARADEGLYTGRDEISQHIQEETGLTLAPSTISKYTTAYNISSHRTKKQAIMRGTITD